MLFAAGGSKAVDNMAHENLQIHIEVRAHLKATNAKYKAEVDKYQCINVFQELIW